MTAPYGDEIDSLRARLTELEAEHSTLIERLERLRGGAVLPTPLPQPTARKYLTPSLAKAVGSNCTGKSLRCPEQNAVVRSHWSFVQFLPALLKD